MNDEELKKIWQQLDTRISTINSRTKTHTLQISQIQKDIQKLNDLLMENAKKL